MRTALVSIIMPVYNSEKYLCKTIESILTQTYSQIELICVDDGSIDNSLNILKKYCSCDNRIQILSQKNQYAGVARNNGKRVAKGKYIIFLDVDDLFEQDMIEKVVCRAEETNAQIIIFDAWIYSNKTRERKSTEWILNRNLVPNRDIFSAKDCTKNIFNITTTAAWNKLYDRNYIEELGILFQNTNHINDLLFTSCAIVMAERISIVDEKLMAYRIQNENSLQGKKKRVSDFIEAFKALFDFLNHKGIWHIYKESYAKLCFNNIVEYLHQQNSIKDFEEFYDLVKDELLPLYNDELIDVLDDKYIYDRFCHLHNDTSREYLFFEYMYEKERDSSLCKTINDLEDDTDNLNSYIKDLNSYIDDLNFRIQSIEAIIDKKMWRFPFEIIPARSRVIIYGAGDVGKDFYKQLSYNQNFEVVGWVDRNYIQIRKIYKNVEAPERVKEKEFDYVIIAVVDEEVARDIELFLFKLGIPKRKIVLFEN